MAMSASHSRRPAYDPRLNTPRARAASFAALVFALVVCVLLAVFVVGVVFTVIHALPW
jgi:cell division septal protein FtsQ